MRLTAIAVCVSYFFGHLNMFNKESVFCNKYHVLNDRQTEHSSTTYYLYLSCFHLAYCILYQILLWCNQYVCYLNIIIPLTIFILYPSHSKIILTRTQRQSLQVPTFTDTQNTPLKWCHIFQIHSVHNSMMDE